MKENFTIAHYFLGFEPLHNGGLLIYVKSIVKELQKQGFNVILLFPGIQNKKNVSRIKQYKTINGSKVFQIVNAQKITFSGIKKPREFIKEKKRNNYEYFFKKYNVRILHIHTLIGLPIELIDAAKKSEVKVVFTTHDYFGLCPKINLYNYHNRICYDFYDGNACIKCNNESKEDSVWKRNTY